MKTFEVIDISGDAGIRAYGESLEDLFVNAAMGMYSLITDPAAVREERHIALDIESHSLEGLLVSWLNELIFHFDTYGFVGKRIVITEITPTLPLPRQGGGEPFITLPLAAGEPSIDPLPWREGLGRGTNRTHTLKATVSGEDFDPERHEKRLLIKAATYHRLTIEKKEGQWVTDVIFDI